MSNVPRRIAARRLAKKKGLQHFICLSALAGVAGYVVLLQTNAVGQTPAATKAPSATKAAAKSSPLAKGPSAAAKAVSASTEQHQKMLNTYCMTCHSAKMKSGGLVLEGLNLQAAPQNAETWEKVLRKLRGRLMPPPGNPQPQQSDIDAFTIYMTSTLDAHPGAITAGHVPVERLNRTEYTASVKDLLGVEVNEKDILPQDVQMEGFDNIASVLTTSPAFLDQYIDAARRVAKKAVGDMHPPLSDLYFKTGGNQDPELPFPPGLRARSLMNVTTDLPADGEYRFNFSFDDRSIGLYNGGLQNRTTFVMMIDGKVTFKGDIGGAEDLRLANVGNNVGWQKILDRFTKIPVKLEAGPHTIILGFIDRAHVESDDNVGGGGGGFGGGGGGAPVPNLMAGANTAMEIKGPYNPTGISHSASRPLIFVCDPAKLGEEACAKKIGESLARRAYRRPVTPQDVDKLMLFYKEGRLDNGNFDHGVTELVAGVLTSPDFLFRSIQTPKTVVKNAEFPLSDLELASRLSFFIWSTGPDEELLKLADTRQLTKPGVLDAQVKRMMADPKAESLVSSFAMKWLNLTSLDLVQPDPMIFRNFDATTRKDYLKESRLFLDSILMDNKNVMELLTSDKTFLNSRLATFYGVTGGPSTPAFKEVTLTDPNRFGLLGKAAILMRTSYADRTSPVLRGAWVLDKIIGTPPTPPPPNVGSNLAEQSAEAPKTVRARLEQHRDKPACKQCHGVIDPTGLALENFDAVGQYRTTDRQANNAAIDASTVMPSGVAINGPVELRSQLTNRPEFFVGALTEKLMMYAVNRPLEYFDMPQVRKVVRNAKKDDYTLASLVSGIVNTDAFRKQAPAATLSKAAPKSSAVTTAEVKKTEVKK